MKRIVWFFLLIPCVSYGAMSDKCPSEVGYKFTNDRDRNPTPGGFVSSGAHVSENSFIAPTAAVCGSAYVTSSRLLGNSVVKDNAYVESSTLMGNAIIEGDASVSNSILRGFHHYSTGNIDGLKTYKDQSLVQKNAAKSNLREDLQLKKTNLQANIRKIEGTEIAIMANRYNKYVDSYQVDTLLDWANQSGKLANPSNPAAYYLSSGLAQLERYRLQLIRYKSDLESVERKIRNL